MIRRFIVAAALSLTAGCAQMRATVGEDDQARQLSGLIAYAQNVAAMHADSQRLELTDAKQTYSKEHTPYARVRLALLLLLPGTGFADDISAEALLEPLAASSAEGSRTDALLQFGAWLHAQVADRTREQKLSAQLKGQLEGERAREQKKSAQLQEQLDALRTIERTLIDRTQGPAR